MTSSLYVRPRECPSSGFATLSPSDGERDGVRGLCSLSASLIWLPTRKTGFNDAPGS